MNFKLSDLTPAGWVLTIMTLGIIVVLMICSIELAKQFLPAGPYPVLLLAAPGLMIGFGVFAIGAVTLRALGFPVFDSSAEPQSVVPHAIQNCGCDLDRVGEAGPYSEEEFKVNAVAGAAWDARQAMRKAKGLVSIGRLEEALDVLATVRGPLPQGPDRLHVDTLISQVEDLLRVAPQQPSDAPPA